jgi:hypothetical protein
VEEVLWWSVKSINRSVKVIGRSVMVCRRAGGFRKGSEKRSGVLREGVVGVGV